MIKINERRDKRMSQRKECGIIAQLPIVLRANHHESTLITQTVSPVIQVSLPPSTDEIAGMHVATEDPAAVVQVIGASL
jgi:hypothetical protein